MTDTGKTPTEGEETEMLRLSTEHLSFRDRKALAFARAWGNWVRERCAREIELNHDCDEECTIKTAEAIRTADLSKVEKEL